MEYNVPLNYVVGLPVIATVSGATLLIVAGVYYLSRFRYNVWLALAPPGWFFYSHVFTKFEFDGPTDIFFLLIIIMMVWVVPIRK